MTEYSRVGVDASDLRRGGLLWHSTACRRPVQRMLQRWGVFARNVSQRVIIAYCCVPLSELLRRPTSV